MKWDFIVLMVSIALRILASHHSTHAMQELTQIVSISLHKHNALHALRNSLAIKEQIP